MDAQDRLPCEQQLRGLIALQGKEAVGIKGFLTFLTSLFPWKTEP